MSKTASNNITLTSLLLISAACGGTSSTGVEARLAEGPFAGDARALASQDDAVERVKEVLSGEPGRVEEGVEHGRPVWEVHVRLDGGAPIEVKVDQGTGHVVELKGDEAPFDYDLSPDGFVTLQQAIAEAMRLAPGTLIRWKLHLEEDGSLWEYELEVLDADGEEQEVEVDAESGRATLDR